MKKSSIERIKETGTINLSVFLIVLSILSFACLAVLEYNRDYSLPKHVETDSHKGIDVTDFHPHYDDKGNVLYYHTHWNDGEGNILTYKID